MKKLLAALLLAPALAAAQTTTTTTTTTPTTVIGVPPSLEVARLAPQLVSFAGGQTNFDSLANGLALGSTVTLVTALSTGQTQTVTFTPQGTMSVTQIAQTLESTRQSLISRGIAAPNGQQVAIALTGGALPTQTGIVQVAATLPAANLPVTTAAAGGTVNANTTGGSVAVTTTVTPAPGTNGPPSPAAIIQGQTQSPSGTTTTPPSPAQIIQNQRGANISDTPVPGNISNTPSVSGSATTGTAAGGTTVAPAAPVSSGR